MKHKTKDGKLIDLKDLELDHLNNIINWIERKAKEGLFIKEGGGHDAEEMWYDEYTIYGQEVKNRFSYNSYKKELESRIGVEKKDSIEDFFKSIDYALLQEQKEELLKFQFDCDYGLPVETLNKLEGLVNFIDSIQDFAVDKLGYKESEIFNLEEND